MTGNEQIQHDLGVKLSTSIEELMQRQIGVAEVVLPAPNIAAMLLNTAMGVNASVASAVLQARKPGEDPAALFDKIATAMTAALIEHKAKVLDGLALIEAGRTDEARRRYGAGRGR